MCTATDYYHFNSVLTRVFLTEEWDITVDPDDIVKVRDLGDGFNAYLLSSGEVAWGERTVELPQGAP